MIDAGPVLLIPDPIDPAVLADHMPLGTIVDIGGDTMGTRWSARLVVREPGVVAAVRTAIGRALAQIIAEMSTWEAASLISRFNAADAGAWFTLPQSMFTVVEAALAVARASGGAFDPTAGRLVDLWGFGAHRIEALPDDQTVEATRAGIGWHRLPVDPATRRVCQPGGIALDLSGIAKGFAVDRLATILRDHGIANSLVEIGGELVGSGIRPDGQPWWVDIEPPPGFEDETVRIALSGLCLATSGDYRRFHDIEGRRHGHSIDPRTGRPIDNGVVSVSVVAGDCMTADALATAISIIGADAGMAFADARDLPVVMFVDGVEPRRLFSAGARRMLAE